MTTKNALRGFALLAAIVCMLAMSAPAAAFHSGGVAECGGCHSMHTPKAGGTFLLVGSDPSSTCLSCHESASDTGPTSYHISTPSAKLGSGQPPLQRTPGGDFAWLKKDYTHTMRCSPPLCGDLGEKNGHSIVAADYGYTPDSKNATAPGGAFPSGQLACNSCHDQHGRYRRDSAGNVTKTGGPIVRSGSYNNSAAPLPVETVGVYRLLAGAGYTKDGVTFSGVPAAVAPSSYNRTEASTQTRVAYGHKTNQGHVSWGDWCATCHPSMHSNGNYVHPVDDTLGSTIATAYGQYVKSGDMTGSLASSFTSLVPFIENTGDYSVLASHAVNDNSQLGGPATNDRVSCLSCHRAHAGGWEYGLRWSMKEEFITYNGLYPGLDTTPLTPFARGRLSTETQAAYYDRPVTQFASYQRVLCNKCHAKD